MTNQQALQQVVSGISLEDLAIEKALLDAALVGTADYTADSKAAINGVAISLLNSLLSVPDITEGGYSIRYDRASILKRISLLNEDNGSVDVLTPQLKNISDRW